MTIEHDLPSGPEDAAVRTDGHRKLGFGAKLTLLVASLLAGQALIVYVLQAEKLLTIVVSGIIPLVAVILVRPASTQPRIRQLLIIEYIFMLICIVSIISIRLHSGALLPFLGVLFALWF